MTAMLASEDGRSLLRHSRFDRDATRLANTANALAEDMLAMADEAIRRTLHR
jgi:hypothetical protein